MTRRFRSKLAGLDMGKGGRWPCVNLPFRADQAWGLRGHVRVKGTINGVPFRSTLLPVRQGRHVLCVNRTIRESAGIEIGDPIAVVLGPDIAPRPVRVPRELKAALAGNPRARLAFESIPPSHRRAYASYIAEARTPEARERRAAKAVVRLAGR